MLLLYIQLVFPRFRIAPHYTQQHWQCQTGAAPGFCARVPKTGWEIPPFACRSKDLLGGETGEFCGRVPLVFVLSPRKLSNLVRSLGSFPKFIPIFSRIGYEIARRRKRPKKLCNRPKRAGETGGKPRFFAPFGRIFPQNSPFVANIYSFFRILFHFLKNW